MYIYTEDDDKVFRAQYEAAQLCRSCTRVEVVRCRDCKYFYRDDEYKRAWCCYDKCGTHEVAVNGYCYRGERRATE